MNRSGNHYSKRLAVAMLPYACFAFFAGAFLLFCLFQPKFRDPGNLMDIVEQSVPVAIVGVGMTFVLLTAGIDLAVGSTMYIAVVVSGLLGEDLSIPVAALASISTGLAIGLVHGGIINSFQLAPFIVTLATMFMVRGVGKRLTQTKAIIAPENVTQLERDTWVGVPLAICVLLLIVLAAWILLHHTAVGRQIYAVGENPLAARKAGIHVPRIIFLVYMVCGACAGLAGFLAFSQQGAAQNTFGTGIEFSAVAAAVLGGTSLFGGRGNVLGAVFGAIFVSVVHASLNFANADPYTYPLVTAMLIFVAGALDSIRTRLMDVQTQRRIRND